jgi:spoIIIJ-associated protein
MLSAPLCQPGQKRDEVSVEIIERSKAGFLGIGAVPARVRVSYEYAESAAEKAEEFLKGLLKRMGSDAVPVVEDRGGEGLFVNLKGDKLGVLIGRRGETLDAIQHVTNFGRNRGLEAAST